MGQADVLSSACLFFVVCMLHFMCNKSATYGGKKCNRGRFRLFLCDFREVTT